MEDKKEGWKAYEGKKVYVKLKSRREYSGVILEVETILGENFITMKDKYNKNVSFNSSEVSVIQEETNGA